MKHTFVIGSGISGLTMALLLAQRGEAVILVEKLPFIGGYLNRFVRQGLHFDTGLHFTGGFNGTLSQILEILNLQDDVKPAPIHVDVNLQSTHRKLKLQADSLEERTDILAKLFPNHAEKIKKYHLAEQDVIQHTPSFDIKNYKVLDPFAQFTDYDAITTQALLEQLKIDSPELQTILPIMALCHGTPPNEAAFSYHARCSYNLDITMNAIQHGGEAFINGFKRELARYNVNILTSTTISSLRFSDTDPSCTSIALSNGETYDVNKIYFTINPSVYAPLFPDKYLTPQFKRRLRSLKPTCAFFSIFGFLDDEINAPNSLTFLLSQNDLNSILTPGHDLTHTSTGIVTSNDSWNKHTTFTAFRTMFLDDAIAHCHASPDDYRQSPEYLDFKQEYTQKVENDIYQAHPEFRGHLHILEASSPLTCCRYSSHLGSAYGTRQFVGTSRPFGKLPVKNCFSLGHHTKYPGILGGLMGAFDTILIQ